MIINVDLSGKKFAYQESLAQIRSCLILQGRTGYFRLDIILDVGGVTVVSLLMNCKTLYIDAFLGANKIWYYFKDSTKPESAKLGIVGNTVALLMDGTHSVLGTPGIGNAFDTNTRAELKKLPVFAGGIDAGLKPALCFAAVVCAEAVRFKEVEEKIETLLTGGMQSYKTSVDCGNLFKNWNALTSVNSAKVTIPYMA